MRNFRLLLLVAILGFVACETGQGQQENLVDADAFEKELAQAKDAQLLDVRTKGEYTTNHMTGALNIDWNGSDFDKHAGLLDKTKPTFVYCQSGGRSASASKHLREMGFTQVIELKGGMRGWLGAGKKAEGASAKQPGMTAEAFQAGITAKPLVLVDFYGKWCTPCRKMAPFLEEIASARADALSIMKLEVDENATMAESFKIEAMPLLMLYKDGKEVWRQTGFIEKEALEKVLDTYK